MFSEFNMAITSKPIEHGQQSLEGIVTYCDDRLARIWIEAVKCEKEITFSYRSRHFNLGDWLMVSLTTDEVYKITPLLETRVLEIGVAQVRTEVVFKQCNEKIGHGTIIQSKHFNRVAVFTPFTGIIINRIYKVYVERIPRDQRWDELASDTYWFVPSNQIPELLPTNENSANDIQVIGPLIGVVVSKSVKFAFVWTPTRGEGICQNHQNLLIGGWIKFMAKNHGSKNISFRIIEWTMADPILACVPLPNNILLVSTIYISHWPMNNLFVDWIGSITDRNRILEKAVCNFGVRQTYEVTLKRLKKSRNEPVTIWNVYQVLGCVNRRREGIVCFVDIQKSLALVYIQDAKLENGRMLDVDLKVFEAVPALGDWFIFEINGSSQFWSVINAVKCRKLCISHIFNDQLQVQTEVVPTDKISPKGHRIMFSVVLGAVAVDANRLSDIVLDASQKYTVWCTAMRARTSDDPYWRITNFRTLPMKSRDSIAKPMPDVNTEEIHDVSYIGIVVGGCCTGYFVWTPLLAEIICYNKKDLRIGDWIRFWIKRKQRAHSNGKPFFINKWEKINSPCPTREENNTVVVTVELMVSENYNSRQLLSLPFFGEVLDKKHCFGAHIDDIRGHIIEMDIKRIRTTKNAPSWNITFVSVKGPLHRQEKSLHTKAVELNADPVKADAIAIRSNVSSSNGSAQNAITFFNDGLSFPAAEAIINECSYCPDFKQKDCGNHFSTIYSEKKEHHEDNHGINNSQKDDAELDPIICSMKLLFMSKEVREAIKINCREEYTILCQYFDVMP
ncbi:N-acyl-aromatic-L-amino acid amidohydrolase (carboxylate-forming) [Dirofilaria immitis]